MIKPGLRLEIIFTLAIVMVTASLLIGIVVMTITKKSIVDQKVENSITLINFFQHSIDSIYSGNDQVFQMEKDNWKLQRLVSLFLIEKDVETIFVVDLKGRVIAANVPEQIGTIFHDKDLKQVIDGLNIITRLPNVKSTILHHKITDKLSLSAPLFIRNRVAGAVRMTLSLKNVQQTINKAYKFIATYIIFTFVIIIIFGGFLLSRLIVRPIKKLVDATESIAKGDFSQYVGRRSRNEISHLSFTFNQMADRIKKQQRQLQNQIESLEKANLQLRQSQKEVVAGEKLALVGTLAAGIAHEIGNPLSAVLGYINLLKREAAGDEKTTDYIKRVEQELNRINKTIREFLDFSRLKKKEVATVDIKMVVENSFSLVAHQKTFQDIILISHLEEELWPTEGDEHQFQQVLLNLLLNAGDALGEGGRIVVMADRMIFCKDVLKSYALFSEDHFFSQVSDFDLGKKEIHIADKIRFSENKPIIRILVADNGKGIESGNLDKIVEPFFTTKEPGKGTGLGLAICTRIIESYGGSIIIRSQVNKGSAFLLLLPAKGKDFFLREGKNG
ncbi:MAG: HAMP domain-containing protein [Proteobacteria bacterium]|nr:HAMP domain-containing protein [Pseudomonadota bacterium]